MVLRTLCIILILLLHNISLYSENGILSAKIIDGESNKPMKGATIRILNSKFGTYSDINGDFKIRNIPNGIYTCQVSFIGYETYVSNKVEIIHDKETTLNTIILKPSQKMLEEIVVEANFVNDNSVSSLTQRQKANSVSDGLSAEEISQNSDGDAGNALKRVSGITLVDNKHLYIRGVSERYSNTTLNGATLTSTEPDKKTFAFDMFPSEFLQNIQVSKSFTPDMPGNFAGGLVQLNTIDFPTAQSLKISYSTNFNTNTNMLENQFFASKGGSLDWLGMDDGSRALSNIIPNSRREIDNLRNKSLDPFDNTGAKEKYQNLIRSFNDKNLDLNRSTIGPLSNSGINFLYSDIFKVADNDLGIISSVNYSNTFRLQDINRNALMADGSNFYVSNGVQSIRNINWGAMLNISYKFGTNHSISLRNMYNRSADDESSIISGQDSAYQFRDYKNFSSQWVEKYLLSSQLVAKHYFPNLYNTELEWRLSFSHSSRYEPDFRRIKFDRDLYEIEYNPSLKYEPLFVQTEYGDPNRLGRFYSDLGDKAIAIAYDYIIPINNMKIKIGSLYEDRKRHFNARSFAIIPPTLGSDYGDDIKAVINDINNLNGIFDNDNFRVDDGFRISEGSKLSDQYSASEGLFASYFMIDMPLSILAEDLRFIGGVRYEDNSQILNSFNINDQPLKIEQLTNNFLPSLNLIWKLKNNSNLRLAFSHTITRPSLREFAPFQFYDFINQVNITGNPNLKQSLIQNYDLRYEYFPNPGEVISLSLFAKNIANAIEETIFPQQSELTKTFANSIGVANNIGIEFELRKNLEFISNFLDDFSINFNLSLINSEIELSQGGVNEKRAMWGQSPYSINVALYYFNAVSETAVNLTYNTFGKRIIQVAQVGLYNFSDPHIYEMPRNLLDLSISQTITNSFEVKLSIKDILNEYLVWLQGGNKVAATYTGTNISMSFGFKIF